MKTIEFSDEELNDIGFHLTCRLDDFQRRMNKETYTSIVIALHIERLKALIKKIEE